MRVYAPCSNQQVLDTQGNALAGQSVTFWTAVTGGTQITALQDLTGVALPGGVATTDSYGYFGFQDPNNLNAIYAYAGTERVLLMPSDLPSRLSAVETTSTSNASAITAITASKGAANGIASLDSSSRLPSTQLPLGTYRTSWFSVLDYGAKGDGTTDDTAAIQSALAAAAAFASASASGGFVYFPSATYLISSALSVANNVTLSGAGPTNTIVLTASGAAFSAVTSSSATPSNIMIERMGFLSQATSGTADGINITPTLTNVSNAIIMRDVNVKSFRGNQVYVKNPQNSVLTDVQVTGAVGSSYGINMDGAAGSGPASLYSCISVSNSSGAFRFFGIQSGIVEACQGQASPIGYLVDTCKTLTLASCSTNGCTTDGIKINAGNGTVVQSYVSFGDCPTSGDILYVTGTSTSITINSAIQGSVSGTPTSFIRTDAGCQVLLQQCASTTANNIAANTQVSAGVKAFWAANTTNGQAIAGTEVDITGCSVTFTTIGTNTQCVVTGSFNFSVGTTSTGACDGKLSVDGVVNGTVAHCIPTTAGVQQMANQTWLVTLAASGSHTLKLRAIASATGTYATGNNNTTTITVLQLTA